MKYLGIVLLVIIAFVSNAQDTHAIKDKINELKKKLQINAEADTLKSPNLGDSLNNKINGFKNKLERKVETDTIKINNPLDSLKLKSSKLDSIRSGNPLQSINTDSLPKLNSSVLTGRILGRQDTAQNKVTDSLRSVSENAKQKAVGVQNKIQNASDSVSQKLTNKVGAIQSKIEDKLSGTTGKDINVPSSQVKLPDMPQQHLPDINNALATPELKIPGMADKLPGTTTEVPGLKRTVPGLDSVIPNMDGNLSGIDLKTPQLEGNALPGIEGKTPEINTSLQEVDVLKDVSEINSKIPTLRDSTGKLDFSALEKIPSSEKVQGIAQKMDEVSGLKDEAGQYGEQIKEVKEKGIEDINTESLEHEATRLAEVKEFDEQTQKLRAAQAKQAELLQRYQDKKFIQEEMKRKTANVVNDQLTKFSPAIKDAQSDMTKTKKVYESSSLVPDSAKRKKRINTMAGKPLKRRIVPGFTFQTYSGEDEVLFDLSPQVGYRLTGWLTVGAAGVYRIGVGKANPSFVAAENIYGYRLYTDYLLVRGIFIHADFESLQVGQPQVAVPEFPNERVLGSYFGLGKRYSISRNIQGSLSGLFRVNYSGSISGQSKFAVRVGFDYVFKKKRKLNGLK